MHWPILRTWKQKLSAGVAASALLAGLVVLVVLLVRTSPYDQVIAKLHDIAPDPDVIDALVAKTGPAPLLAALKDDDPDVRCEAVEAIGRNRFSEGVGPLMNMLADRSCVTHQVVLALGRIGNPSAVEPLIVLLHDSDSQLRLEAATSLGQIGNSRATDDLIAALGDDNWMVAAAAVKALGLIGHPKAVPPLIALLGGDDGAVASVAAEALGGIGDGRAVRPLIGVLAGHGDSITKERAIQALGKLGDSQAVEPLVRQLHYVDRNQAAARSLRELSWQPRNTAEQVAFHCAQRDTTWLKTNWPEVKRTLLEDIQSDDPAGVAFGLHAFTAIGNDEVLPELLRVIDTQGTVTIAQAYLNCNQPALRKAAMAWARKHGYDVVRDFRFTQTWNWGSW